jgi:hypothetical protein
LHVSARSSGCVGPDMSVLNGMWTDSILDQHRYVDSASRILARYEDVGPNGLNFGDDEELDSLGVDRNLLATALDENALTGIDVAALFDELKSGSIDDEQFNDAVGLRLVPDTGTGLSVEDRLTAAVHIPDIREAARFHPDDHLDRVLHSRGLCSCHVERVA